MEPRGLDRLQKVAMTLMAGLAVFTFMAANLHAVLWQSSEWLVSTVLPSVVVNLTNAERADNSALPLQRSAILDKAAKLKAEHMAKNEYFAHFSPDGVSPWHWFDQAGYVYAHAGENLAIHFTDSSEVVEAWMKSPLHRANIVNNKYTEIGVGTVKGTYEGYDTVYVVQLFGTPAIAAQPAPIATNESVVSDVVTAEAPLAVATEPTPVLAAVDTVAVSEPSISEEVSESVVVESNDVAIEEPVVTNDNEAIVSQPEASEIVVVESSMITTSSGLEPVVVDEPTEEVAKVTKAASVATQPNVLLQIVYSALALVVVVMLLTSIVMEARRSHFPQVAYGFLLLAGMSGLWYAHSLLTTGAVII